MGIFSSKARATAPGSIKNLEDQLRGAINDTFRSDPNTKYDISTYPIDIIPDKPIKSGSLIIEDYSSSKNYSVPFSTDENGNYTLGEKKEVNKIMNYEAVKSSVLAVEKAKDHVMFTGTALIPGEPDCDATNGEELLTAEKVAKIAHSFMDYRIVDKEHEFLVTKKNMGDPVESYLLDAPKVMKNIKGEEREYPEGTWVVKSKITDPEMMKAALKGEIAYSVSVLSEEDADKVMASMKNRVLIKDIKNPVGFTLSLTKNPCVDNSCSVKSAMKAGRAISKENKSVLEKARDIINSLINQADSGRNGGDNVSEKKEKDEKKEYVEKSDVEDMVKKAVKEAMNDEKEESASKSVPTECSNCKVAVKSTDKYCSSCGTKISTKEKNEEDEEETPGGASKSLKPNGGDKPTPAVKSFEEELGRDLYGCKS
ncbi:phage-related protein [Methanobacterium formicicum]|uniref:Phage-related protein n=1 Tax=Methanobacterium formicicum TaxID=2162 RepID=A0A089ZEN1_METFO|nr:XkdF-like putative serine protease domain-containing protein [Methanobacterium formicicum]AIS32482.1 phage-related protein [Methanobacterium formicicum]